MSDTKLKIAVFIDFDNIEIGVKTTLNLAFDIGAVLEAIKERGEVITKLAYGDWKRSGDYGRAMAQHAVRMVQRVTTPGGDKNGADINLALDALEMAFTHSHINAFVIVGGDSDFITLVEKLKQYDRKVFVVGGRAFTSQVMQKNCTEFIAYENIVPDSSTGSGPSRAQSRDGRGRSPKQEKGERQKSNGTQSIDQAVPLVMRALKVLTDREVTPQLGLLKSTLLQLDSSFSERDYGAGSFREFADKLAKQGLVSLKHQGRSTLVELPDGQTLRLRSLRRRRLLRSAAHRLDAANGGNGAGQAESRHADRAARTARFRSAGCVARRRRRARAARARRRPRRSRDGRCIRDSSSSSCAPRSRISTSASYGSIADLMRACQKDGLLRLERDRQGALRVFASGGAPRASVPHGWGVGTRENGPEQAPETLPVLEVVPEVIASSRR